MIVTRNLRIPLDLKSENIQNKALLEARIEELRKGERIKVPQAAETLMRFQVCDHTKLRRLDASGNGAPFPDVRKLMTNAVIQILKDPIVEQFRKSAAGKIVTVSVLEGTQEVSSMMLGALLELFREGTIQSDAQGILTKIFADSDLATISRLTNQITRILGEQPNKNDGALRASIGNAIEMAELARRDRFSQLRILSI
jgi:hypothetical protein